jgi:ABC-type nitrate/sulfonate/bicarbonate transport system ATPase subunit
MYDYLGESLNQNGTTLLIATHDFEEAALLSDEIWVFRQDAFGVADSIKVNLPWPRKHADRQSPEVAEAVRQIISATL